MILHGSEEFHGFLREWKKIETEHQRQPLLREKKKRVVPAGTPPAGEVAPPGAPAEMKRPTGRAVRDLLRRAREG